MDKSIKFTAILPDQSEQIRSLAEEIWPQVYAEMISSEQIDYMLEWMYEPDKIRHEIEAEGVIYFLIHSGANSETCGFFAFGPIRSGESCFIHKIYVHPDHHRQGIATKTMAKIEKIATVGDASSLELRVNRGNSPAIELYQKTGFKIVAEDCADIGGGFVMDDFIFRKSLIN